MSHTYASFCCCYHMVTLVPCLFANSLDLSHIWWTDGLLISELLI